MYGLFALIEVLANTHCMAGPARARTPGETHMARLPTPILLGEDAPRVLSIPMIAAALSDRRRLVARGTLFKWIRSQVTAGALRPVTRGLYLNRMAQPMPSAAEAAGYVRAGAIVSLQTVLGEAGITNGYADMVTCIVPIRSGVAPSSRPVRVEGAEFRFHAMPVRLLDNDAGSAEDRLDPDVLYARASPEKALLDWIYLGASPRTKLAGPPLDIDLRSLDMKRLARLGIAMKLARELESFLARSES
jgi:hypothetical protein